MRDLLQTPVKPPHEITRSVNGEHPSLNKMRDFTGTPVKQ